MRDPGLIVVDRGWRGERVSATELRLAGGVGLRADGPRAVVVRDVVAQARLLSGASLGGLVVLTNVACRSGRGSARADGAWRAQVVTPAGRAAPEHDFDAGVRVEVEVVADVAGPPDALDQLYAAALEVDLVADGVTGRGVVRHHALVPLAFPDPAAGAPWRSAAPAGTLVKPIRTHLLGPSDDPAEVVGRYALPHARPGDVVAMGESPLAIMQGRFCDPRQLRPGWAATRLSQFLSGEGSLGTAGGMEVLVGELGPLRVAAALAGGLAGKVAGRDGWFYRLAGRQASLVDDVTGSLPPYDRLVVSGPHRAMEVCAEVTAATGLAAAVVDANDLGFVDVVGASPGVSEHLVVEALRTNPAGNADETTPLVLIRPPSGPTGAGGPAAGEG